MATFQAVVLKGDIHVRQDKTSNIKIRITHKGKPEYISTDLFVHHKKFKKGQATGNDDSVLFLNGRIRDELKKYTDRYLKMGSLSERLTVKELKQQLQEETSFEQINFLEYADKYVKELLSQGRTGSARGLTGVISNLKKFRETIYFHEIDTGFLNDFVAYLKRQGVKNAVDNYMREFRLLFKAGREKFNDEDRGIIKIPNYPFRKFRFEKIRKETELNRLTLEQLKMLILFNPETQREQLGKDVFLIMLYLIGINCKDLFFVKPPKKGRVEYKRFKTGRDYSIKVEPELEEMIQKYRGSGEYLFNFSVMYKDYLYFLHASNVGLQSICTRMHKKFLEENKEHPERKLDFPEVITTNWARHTWATIARNDCRIPKDDVALCMGHEDQDNKVTDIYINYDYSIIDEANRRVLKKL